MNDKIKQIDCIITKKKSEALDCLPYHGELGKKIYQNVSKEGWQMWLSELTMLINDYGLRTCDESAQQLIEDKMNEFFFSDKPLNEKTFNPPNPVKR